MNDKPHLQRKIDWKFYESFVSYRRTFEYLAQLATTPIKFPARRRRSDREIPKAA